METGLVQPPAIREGNQTMVENTNCEQVWNEISSYIDGEVDGALRSAMEEHFRACPKCASVLAGTRNVVELYGDERMLEVPVGFGLRLEKRLEKKLAGNAGFSGLTWRGWSGWLIPVAALALIAGGLKWTGALHYHPPAKSILSAPPNDVPPEMQVVVSSGSKVFHVPGCPFIHDKSTERMITAKEAMRDGYVPCPRCLRQYLKTSLTHTPGQQVADVDEEDADQDREELSSVVGR